jgi:hypothetical protein
MGRKSAGFSNPQYPPPVVERAPGVQNWKLGV